VFVEIAQLATTETISLVVAKQTVNFVVDHTETDPDSIPLKVGSMCVGKVVALKLKPHTDKAIVNAADWMKSKRNKKEATEKSSES
jgi:hypothetical protein